MESSPCRMFDWRISTLVKSTFVVVDGIQCVNVMMQMPGRSKYVLFTVESSPRGFKYIVVIVFT